MEQLELDVKIFGKRYIKLWVMRIQKVEENFK